MNGYDFETPSNGKRSESLLFGALLWLIGLSIAGPIIATFGLYDYSETSWHKGLQLLPVLLLLAGIKKRTNLKAFWKRLNPLQDHRKFLIGHIVVFSLVVSGTVWFLSRGRDVTLSFCNIAPYEISTAVHYKLNRRQWQMEGYWNLAPGACKNVEVNVLRVTPKFYVLAVEKEALTSWLDQIAVPWDFGKQENLTWLHGNAVPSIDPKEALTKKLQGEEISWETTDTRCVGKSLTFTYGEASSGPSMDCSKLGNHRAHFLELPYSFENSDRYDVWFLRGGTNVTLQFCNLLPYQSAVSLHYQSKRAQWKTDSPLPIGPGECKSLESNFQGVEPKLYTHHVIRGDVEKWHLNSHGAPDEWRSTERDLDGRVLPHITACLGEEARAVNDNDQVQTCREGEALRPFVPVETVNEIQYLSSAALPVPEKGDGTIDLEKARSEAKALRDALFQRMLHQIRSPKEKAKPIPYLIGVAIFPEDFYGEHFRGITVSQAQTTTPFGVRVPLVPGDEIVAFDGKPIFSIEDLRRALVVFAESKAKWIVKPYSVTVNNKGQEVTRWGWFFFNEAAFQRSEYDRQRAYDWGSSAGWSLLGDPVKRRCAKDPSPDCLWEKTQEFWRLKQMYLADYDNGEFWNSIGQGLATIIVLGPIARVLRWLLGLGHARTAIFASEVLVGSSLSAAQFATLAAIDSPPGGNVHKEVREAAKLGAKLGFASAFIGPLKAHRRLAR